MTTYKKILFPFYEGNIRLTKVIGYVSYERFVESIKNPKPNIKLLLEQIQVASKEGNLKLKKELKKKLFSFTPSVLIGYRQKREYASIINFTGVMQLDLDGINDYKELLELKKEIFSYTETLCIFESPSKKGLKALIKTQVPKNIQHYKAIHKAYKFSISNEYFDDATKSAVQPMYLSYDENILYRSFQDADAFMGEDWSEDESIINLKTEIEKAVFVPDGTESQRAKNYREKTIRIFETKINNIQDNGHPQVRGAGLVLGSRVAAEYIGYDQATGIAVSAVMNNEYLQKDIMNYVRTVKWSIRKGFENGAKYY